MVPKSTWIMSNGCLQEMADNHTRDCVWPSVLCHYKYISYILNPILFV